MLDRNRTGPGFRAQIPLYLKEGILSLAAATSSVAGYMTAAQAALVAQLATATAWTAPTLATDWSDYSGSFTASGYRKDALGLVHLKGLVKKAVAVATPDTIFTLPVGYRPTTEKIFVVTSNLAFGEVRITTGGAVNVLTGHQNYVALDGIRFDPTT